MDSEGVREAVRLCHRLRELVGEDSECSDLVEQLLGHLWREDDDGHERHDADD